MGGIENIVYKDELKALSDRVKKLEGNGGLTETPNDFERRLSILEAKCRNIHVDEEINVTSLNETKALTLEERLQILERKCSNINV